ncbi:MAG: hypothetical protein ABL958_05145 [Bdellovibrionia bacterium]
MKNNIFEILKEKLQRKPDRYFDQKFWAKFESEFGQETRFPAVRIHKWVTVSIVMSLAISVVLITKNHFDNAPIPADMSQSLAIMNDAEMYEDFDMFLTLEDVNLSDEDWDFLLKDRNG